MTELHNFAPAGIDNAVILEIEPDAGATTLTGIRHYDPTMKRLLAVRNRDLNLNLTLVNQSSLSSEQYRFAMPNSENIVLGPKQLTWLYYDTRDKRWACFITPNLSGGITGAGSTGAGDHVILDGDVHTDSVAQGVTRGSLIYGNSTPKWDELVIGSNNRVLRCDGTDPSWAQVNLTTDVTGVLPGANGGGWTRIVKSSDQDFVTSAYENDTALQISITATKSVAFSGTLLLESNGGAGGNALGVKLAYSSTASHFAAQVGAYLTTDSGEKRAITVAGTEFTASQSIGVTETGIYHLNGIIRATGSGTFSVQLKGSGGTAHFLSKVGSWIEYHETAS